MSDSTVYPAPARWPPVRSIKSALTRVTHWSFETTLPNAAGETSAFGSVVSKLQWVTRVSALLMLLTGGHLAGTGYTVESLTGSPRGYLVLTMVALWLGLAAAVEIGSARAQRGVDDEKIREPARDARPFYLAAAVLAVGLLVVSGLLGMPPAFL